MKIIKGEESFAMATVVVALIGVVLAIGFFTSDVMLDRIFS
jgi:hypothetical protein